MALVDYASSDEEEEAQPPSTTTLKRKREETDLPPLPSRFHDLYASTTRVSTRDDSSLHGGRKRITPHVEGNWPTHIYIEWYPSTTEYSSLTALISSLKLDPPPETTNLKINSFLASDLGAPLPLHISLSRSIGFSTDVKDAFVARLDRAIKSASVRPFDISFTGLDWVPNFEQTRWFLVLRIKEPESNGLNKLLHVCNLVVQEYGQPPLYSKPVINKSDSTPPADPGKRKQIDSKSTSIFENMDDLSSAFHISIAWTLTAPSPELLDLTSSVTRARLGDIQQIQVFIKEIKAKVGNTVTNMPLPKSVTMAKSLFGV